MALVGGICVFAAFFAKNSDSAAATFFVGSICYICGLCAAGRTLDDYRVYKTYPAKAEALQKQKRENCVCACCDKKPREEVGK